MEQITLDILWNRLVATVNEQAAALMTVYPRLRRANSICCGW